MHFLKQVVTEGKSVPVYDLYADFLDDIGVGGVPGLHASFEFMGLFLPPVLHEDLVLVLVFLDVPADTEAYFQTQLAFIGP